MNKLQEIINCYNALKAAKRVVAPGQDQVQRIMAISALKTLHDGEGMPTAWFLDYVINELRKEIDKAIDQLNIHVDASRAEHRAAVGDYYVDTALEEGTRFERAFGDGSDV